MSKIALQESQKWGKNLFKILKINWKLKRTVLRFHGIAIVSIIFLAFHDVVYAQNIKDEFDETIYEYTMDILKPKYNNDSICILSYLKDNKIIDNFYTSELLFEPEMLKKKLEPNLPEAEKSCIVNSKSMSTKPMNLFIAVAAVSTIFIMFFD